jgi:hypothetical protein
LLVIFVLERGFPMAKCFLTGIEMQMKSAYLLDQGATRRALRNLKEQASVLERLLTQFTPKDSVEVFDYHTRKPSMRQQRRMACHSIATALSASYPETPLFISWPEFQARCKALQSKLKGTVAPEKAVAPSSLSPDAPVQRKLPETKPAGKDQAPQKMGAAPTKKAKKGARRVGTE